MRLNDSNSYNRHDLFCYNVLCSTAEILINTGTKKIHYTQLVKIYQQNRSYHLEQKIYNDYNRNFLFITLKLARYSYIRRKTVEQK